MNRQDWVCAEAKFREALTHVSVPVLRYNLASALHQQGQNTESGLLLRIVLECDGEVPDPVRQHATELRAELNATTGELHISVQLEGEEAAGTPVVLVDGEEVAASDWDHLRAPPGEHRVELVVEGVAITARTVTLAAGAIETVALERVPEPVEVAEAATDEVAPPPIIVTEDVPLYEEPGFWVALGVSLVVAGILATIAIVLGTGEPMMVMMP